MSRITLRIAFALAGAIIMGLVAFDVALVFWEQRRFATERRAEMVRLGQQLIAGLQIERSLDKFEYDARGVKRSTLERGFSVRYALQDEVYTWGQFPPSVSCSPTSSPRMGFKNGFEFMCLVFYRGEHSGSIGVVRSVDEALEHVYNVNRFLFWGLAASGLLILVLGLFFLRRSILRPLFRLNHLVGAHDTLGISSYGQDNTGLLGSIGRGIIGMNQQIDDDRARIRHQLEELQSAQTQLVRAERLATVGQLSAGLAHEIGNPLAILQGYVDILGDSNVSEEDRSKALERMETELNRIHETIRSLLDYARLEKDSAQGGQIETALSYLKDLLVPQEKYSQIDFQFPHFGESTSYWVTLSYESMVQLFLNLLLNSIDAMDGVGTIRIEYELSGENIVLWFQDTGPGIQAELVENVFEPFFTTKAAGAGTGLGLSVCDTLVRGAGGVLKVCLENKPADALSGACFELTLPLFQESARSSLNDNRV